MWQPTLLGEDAVGRGTVRRLMGVSTQSVGRMIEDEVTQSRVE